MDKPFAITLDPGSSRANHTGTWRTVRPVYLSFMPPCNNACPAGENIQQWLYNAEEGGLPNYEAAWRQIMADNPFPAIMGRVCYRPCETACNRAQVDTAVGINSVERYLGDQAIAQGWPVQAPPGEASTHAPPSSRSCRPTAWCSRSARMPTWPSSTACPAPRSPTAPSTSAWT
jgi:hypothetical protein